MTRHDKEMIQELSKEQLVYLIEQMDRSLSIIGEICVSESKGHIEPKEAVQKIRENIYHIPSAVDVEKMKLKIDLYRGYITAQEYWLNLEYKLKEKDNE